MAKAEETASENIRKQVLDIARTAKKYNFQQVGQQVSQLKALIEKADKLPGANPEPGSVDREYPFVRQSAYLAGDRPQDVVTKIEAVVPQHACSCDPVKCECSSSDETVCDEEGTKCYFCDLDIPVGSPLHVDEKTHEGLCGVCARILWEKVRFKESVAFAVVNLLGDAATEAEPPYFQYKEALKLVEEAQKRLEAFRLAQRARVAH